MNRLSNSLVIAVLLLLIISGCNRETHNQPIAEDVLAFTNVNIVPMTEEIIFEDQIVLVKEGHILTVGDAGEVDLPRDATVIDGDGGYLMPGLADMHVHIYEESRDEYPVSPLNLYIANGVTTIRDCGTAPITPSDTFVLEWRDEIIQGKTIGPMIYSSGRTIHGPILNPAGVVRERRSNGFDFVKLYMELSVDEFVEAQAAAEELGVYSVGHIPYQVGLDLAMVSGLDEIAHIEELSYELIWSDHRPSTTLTMERWLDALIKELVDDYGYDPKSDFVFNPKEFHQEQGEYLNHILNSLKEHDVLVGTTMVVSDVVDQKIFAKDDFLRRAVNVYLPPELIEAVVYGQDRHQMMFRAIDEDAALWNWKGDLDSFLLQELHKYGIRLVSGTDAGSSSIGVVEGFATHEDLRILVEHGFTPYEALQTATVNAAYAIEKMTGDGDFGTIEAGKRADLVLVSGNPLQDIMYTRDIQGVMVRGNWLSKDELEEMIAIGE